MSNMILSSKCTILAYIASCKSRRHNTYIAWWKLTAALDFALASGATLSLANYFLVGWFNGELDKFYMESWKGAHTEVNKVFERMC
jgi:hypothetical protein